MTSTSPTPSIRETPPAASPVDLPGMSAEALQTLLGQAGFPRFRAKQLYEWIYRHGTGDVELMRNLPRDLRAWLTAHTRLRPLTIERVTGLAGHTQKVLMRCADGRFIESVVMREANRSGEMQTSLCVSSQIGCALACTFCMTGFGGYQRNLTAAEIIAQVLEIRREVLADGEPIQHVVFMGMGEPMLNLDAVVPAIRLLIDPDGIALGRRRVTVSTAGVVNGLERFGREELGVNLAVSLNATTDAVRDTVMPINRKWNLAALLTALQQYPLEQRRRITMEYVLMQGINDTPEDAQRIVALLRDLRCKVNLIMFNETPYLPYRQAPESTLQRFLNILSSANMTVTVRWSKGREIEAACGQLAAHHFEQSGARRPDRPRTESPQ